MSQPSPTSERRNLLIVEDEAVIRFVLKCELEQRGFAVTEFEDGRRALAGFRADPSRWLGAFVDFLLPDTHGDELIEQFLELRPDLPVVLMTGDPDTEAMAKQRKLPILRKPFPLENVRPLLADMVRNAARVDDSAELARTKAALRRTRHQIRNELQLLTSLHALHIRRVDDPRSRHELIRCYRRVGVVGVVHQLTADAGGTVSADTCLETVAEFLEASARTMEGNCDFELRLQFTASRWQHDHATRIALIVDELFANAMNHALPEAKPRVLELSLDEVDGRTCLRMRDFGPGPPEGLDPASHDSLGLPMACAVAQQLGGSLELAPAEGGGTEARLWLPSELAIADEGESP